MKFTPAQYDEIVLALENDRDFYLKYTNFAARTYGIRRQVINVALGWSGSTGRCRLLPHWACRHDIEDRDQIRRYFDDRYSIPQNEVNTYAHIPSWWEKPKAEESVAMPRLNAKQRAQIDELRAHPAFLIDLKAINGTEPRKQFTAEMLCRMGWMWSPTSGNLGHLVAELLSTPPPPPPPIEPVPFQPSAALKDLRQYLDSAKQLCDEVCGVAEITFNESTPIRVPSCPISTPSREHYIEWLASQLTPKEPTVAKPIVITTKTLINGIDIAEHTDSQIYDLIAAEEKAIKELEAINAKPKRLVAEIEKRKSGITALVAHLDSKE